MAASCYSSQNGAANFSQRAGGARVCAFLTSLYDMFVMLISLVSFLLVSK